jgi:hypothetical protein
MDPNAIMKVDGDEPPPEQTLDYFVKARNGNKRNYIFDYKKSKTCTHPELTEMILGTGWYRCKVCNYAFCIVGAIQQPLHNVIQSSFQLMLHSAKEFGANSIGEILRTPRGQSDGTPHKPALPEGMSIVDAMNALEEIDVNVEDGGKAQLHEMLELLWVGPKQRALAEEDKAGQEGRELKEGTDGSDQTEAKAGVGGDD